jgi:diacylglycerol kinase family enzyme
MPSPEICVIYNPTSGRGRGRSRLETLREFLGARAEFWMSNQRGEAEELASRAAESGFQVVGAAGGDGTVNEVANGLLQAKRPNVTMGIYPIGSANDYAFSLKLPRLWWLRPDSRPVRRLVDAGVVRLQDGRERYFVNGLGVGFNGAVTLESQRIRWLQGVPLYSAALLAALFRHYASPRMTLHFDDQVCELPTLALSVAIGQREGNFLIAPEAKVDDGLFDYLHVSRLPRMELLCYLPGMITGRIPVHHPSVRAGRCRRLTLQSEAPLVAHVDGEILCRPEQRITALEARVLPGALAVLSLEAESIAARAREGE